MSTNSNDRRLRAATLAITLTIVMIASVTLAVAVPAAAPDDSVAGGAAILDDGLDEADAVYIDEEGNAVLVYDEEEFDGEEIMIGGDISKGLLHLFLVDSTEPDPVDDVDESELSGSITIEDDLLQADGTYLTPTPEGVESADAFVSGEISQEANELAAGLDLQYVDDSPAAMEGEFESTGEVMLSTDEFLVDASGDYSTGEPASPYPETYEISIDHDGDTFVGEVRQAQTVFEFEADRWETEENVSEHLSTQFEPVADQLGGEASIELHEHSFNETDDGQYYVEVAYEVELQGIQEGFAEVIASELAADPDLSISDEEAQAIADALTAIELNEFDIAYTIDPMAGMAADVSVHVSGLNPVMDEVMGVVENELEDEERIEEFESVRDAYTAQAEADVEHHLTWEVSAISEPDQDGSLVTIDAELEAYSTNWDAYTDEMGNEGLAGADVTFEFELYEQDGELETTGEVRVAQEDLLQAGIDSLVTMVSEEEIDSDTQAVIEALDESELEIARIDYDVSDGEVVVEGGAQFEDLSAAFPDGTPVPDSFVMVDTNETNTYVYVADLIENPEEIDEDAVRETAIADEETAVYLPGEWDEEFPEFDAAAAADYLGIELAETNGEDDSSDDESTPDDPTEADDDLPGFGGIAAVVAIGLGCGYRILRD